MKKVIFDCDNTMGVKGCDVDDGLALLYLLGRPDIELLGVTTVFGNNDIETVHPNTVRMMREIGMEDIPVVKGCGFPNDAGGKAGEFIVDVVSSNDDVSLLATGSLSNLHAADLLDEDVLDKVREIVLMGGLVEPLIINGRQLDELNFSCDPLATECVLRNGRNVSVITGNACLDAFFSEESFDERLGRSDRPRARYIIDRCGYWFKDNMMAFGMPGFYNWDVVAAVRLAEPVLFRESEHVFRPDLDQLGKGFLTDGTDTGSPACSISLPRIADIEAFTDEVYRAWLR